MLTHPPAVQLLPARDARIAALIVSTRTRTQTWRHIMSMTLTTGQLTPGTWTNKSFRLSKCRLSPCGRFFLYAASDHGNRRDEKSDSRPFAAELGGGLAISRLPWLSALTHIQSLSYSGDITKGKHTLSLDDQRVLFSKFDNLEASPIAHQPGWQSLNVANIPDVLRKPTRTPVRSAHAAVITSPRTPVQLIATWTNASTPRFALATEPKTPNAPQIAIKLNATTAWLEPLSGRLLAATRSGQLTLYKPPQVVQSNAGETLIKLTPIITHDCATLTPKPTAPPGKAIAPLSFAEREC